MASKRPSSQEGVTLLELTIAMAIFAVTIGVTAQSLISFYATMDLQHQRNVAVQHCRALLSDMRSVRDAHPNTNDEPTAFQTNMLEQFPDGMEMTGPSELSDSIAIIAYENSDTAANPLIPTVTVQWQDLSGREVSASISTAVTDR